MSCSHSPRPTCIPHGKYVPAHGKMKEGGHYDTLMFLVKVSKVILIYTKILCAIRLSSRIGCLHANYLGLAPNCKTCNFRLLICIATTIEEK